MNDKGTLYQLKHLVHRTAVGSDPKHKTKASEDFLLVVMHALIVAAARSMPQTYENCLTCAKAIVAKLIKVRIPSSSDVEQNGEHTWQTRMQHSDRSAYGTSQP